MKVSLRWLRDYAPLDAPLDHLVRTLNETGTEVGTAEDVAAGIIAARITRLEPVPKSSHGLMLADLDVGPIPPHVLVDLGFPTDPVRVVTGAANLHVGDLVPYAPPGTRPPAMDEPLEVRAFGRHKSPGMLCSPVELGLGDDATGILILERGAPGAPLRDLVDLDVVLDLEITTNRPDCLCHVGIARELAAGLGETLTEPDTSIPDSALSAASSEQRATVTIDDPAGCPRFAVCIIEGVAVGPSPAWMQQRLRAIGLRPINNLVDTTNYVAHELGQPMHAFDLDRFVAAAGGERQAEVVVRRAQQGEGIVTLDGVARRLSSEDMVVCAGSRAVSVAGVMGGATTAVNESTTNVLLEAANWDGPTIRATTRRLNLRTDASTLFEKGLSDTLPPLALGRAAALMAETARGHVLRGSVDAWPRPLPAPGHISLTGRYAGDRLGMPIDATEAGTVLARLGFAVEQDGASLTVVPPHFRRDVWIPIDVVEEVGRMLGYANVPSTLPGRRVEATAVAPDVPPDEHTRDVCLGAGFDEAITFSFTSPALSRVLPGIGGTRSPIPLRNPLTDEWSVLRVSQLPGLCGALATNINRGVTGPALFEVGRVFWEGERQGPVPGSTPDGSDRKLPPLPLEPLVLSAAAQCTDGAACAEQIRHVQSLFDRLAVDFAGAGLMARPAQLVAMRSGRSAELLIDGQVVGVIGELRSDVVSAFELRGHVVVGELRLDAVAPDPPRALRFRAPARFPAIVQDLAVTVPSDGAAGRALDVVRNAGGGLLESVELYDEYRGERIASGRKGWTFRLTFRAPDRTLTSEEAQHAQQTILAALTRECDAELRR
ncbi:MAG: phenylalanine--tRNA ligase subunit beta [Chloroflexi bacterium]|nr:MAG: phenylalanine--tRNA ligase subunit beta [Chloroflexota bacterium]